MTITKNTEFNAITNALGESFVGRSLQWFDFAKRNLKEANFTDCLLNFATLTEANLEGATLINASFVAANLDKSNLTKATLTRAFGRIASLKDAILKDADLRFVNFEKADLRGADLSGADLTGADLTGAKLEGVNLRGVIGIGTREDEVQFAQELLTLLNEGLGELTMGRARHSCETGRHCHASETAHCLAGWRLPTERYPCRAASLLCPTLAQFFWGSKLEVLKGLELVARGELSVFPD